MEKSESKNEKKVIREIETPDPCCGAYEDITVKDISPRFSLRNTAEAKELISNNICHEG